MTTMQCKPDPEMKSVMFLQETDTKLTVSLCNFTTFLTLKEFRETSEMYTGSHAKYALLLTDFIQR